MSFDLSDSELLDFLHRRGDVANVTQISEGERLVIDTKTINQQFPGLLSKIENALERNKFVRAFNSPQGKQIWFRSKLWPDPVYGDSRIQLYMSVVRTLIN